jgi:hypothetical protein
MVEFSRRRFLKQTSIGLGAGVAAAGVAAALPRAGQAAPTPPPERVLDAPTTTSPATLLAEPMVVHVRAGGSGEIAVLAGTQEFVYRDPELVARLARRAAALGREA